VLGELVEFVAECVVDVDCARRVCLYDEDVRGEYGEVLGFYCKAPELGVLKNVMGGFLELLVHVSPVEGDVREWWFFRCDL